jgi:nucleotide-binding universal stress UspA family protein
MRYDRVLVATDLSEPALAAVRAGRALAARFGARVRLLHAQIPILAAEGLSPEVAEVEQRLRIDHERRLDALRGTELAGITSEARVVMDPSPAAAIVDACADADLCVVGTHGRTGAARFFLGSVAERVVRHAPCDVLVARSAAPLPPRRVLACTDFSEGSFAAIDAARSIAGVFGIDLVIAHVIDPETPVPSEDGRRLVSLGEVRSRAERSLRDLVAERVPGARASIELLTAADPAERLSSYAAHQDFGLVVVGTHGRTGLRRFFLGSVAERTVRLATSPVLVVRER